MWKYTSHLQWLISPKSVWSCAVVVFMMLVLVCRLASRRHGVRLLYLISHVFTAWWPHERSFQSERFRWSENEFLFCVGMVLFPGMHRPYFLLGLLGIIAFLELILFYFILFYFLSTTTLSTGLSKHWLYPLLRVKSPLPKKDILRMTLNYIWWWGSSSGGTESV